MTYCVGIKVADGLVCMADGRITSGNQLSAARKVTFMESGVGSGSAVGADTASTGTHRFVIMNSGLRSVRDKALTYLRAEVRETEGGLQTLLAAVEAFSRCLRRVRAEDGTFLEESKLSFNVHALIGGQLTGDDDTGLYLVYPEGNWIEVDERTPYLSIGAVTYGKPILDRVVRSDTDLASALKAAYLSFDSSRFSSSDVGYPIDLLTYRRTDRQWRMISFEYDDLRDQRRWWNTQIKCLASSLPDDPWIDALVPRIDPD